MKAIQAPIFTLEPVVIHDPNESKSREALEYIGTILDYISLFCIIIFTSFLALRLHKGPEEFSMNWYLIFSPLWIMSFFVMIYLLIFEIESARNGARYVGSGKYLHKVNFRTTASFFTCNWWIPLQIILAIRLPWLFCLALMNQYWEDYVLGYISCLLRSGLLLFLFVWNKVKVYRPHQ